VSAEECASFASPEKSTPKATPHHVRKGVLQIMLSGDPTCAQYKRKSVTYDSVPI